MHLVSHESNIYIIPPASEGKQKINLCTVIVTIKFADSVYFQLSFMLQESPANTLSIKHVKK